MTILLFLLHGGSQRAAPPAPGLQEGRARLGAAIPRVLSAAGRAAAPWVTRSSGKPMTPPGRASWCPPAIPALMALTKNPDKQRLQVLREGAGEKSVLEGIGLIR